MNLVTNIWKQQTTSNKLSCGAFPHSVTYNHNVTVIITYVLEVITYVLEVITYVLEVITSVVEVITSVVVYHHVGDGNHHVCHGLSSYM